MKFNLKNKNGNNLKINGIFNAIYQVSSLLVSLLLTPYLSNVFGVNGVGSYSYAFSIVNTFIIVATFGFNIYGTTKIAKSRNSEDECNKNFWSLFYTKGIFSTAIVVVYLILLFSGVFLNPSYSLNNNVVYLVMSLDIIYNLFDLTFLFQGKEKFVSLSVRNILVKISSLFLVLIFVKSIDDYLIYVVIMSLTYIFNGLFTCSGFFGLCKKPVKVNFSDLKNDLIESFYYFVPILSGLFCTNLSKTFIGLLTNDSIQSGFYENADKIINICVTFLVSLSSVLISRFSYLASANDNDEILAKREKIMWFFPLVIFPLFFGLISINDYLVEGFLGSDFTGSIILIYILSLRIVFEPLSETLSSIYYLPYGKIRLRNIIYISYGLFSVLAILILTYFFQAVGTAIAIILSHLLMVFLLAIFCRREVSFKPFFSNCWRCFVSGGVMCLILFLLRNSIFELSSNFLLLFEIANLRISYLLATILLIIIGAIIYFFMIILLKEKFTRPYVCMIVNRFKRSDK